MRKEILVNKKKERIWLGLEFLCDVIGGSVFVGIVTGFVIYGVAIAMLDYISKHPELSASYLENYCNETRTKN